MHYNSGGQAELLKAGMGAISSAVAGGQGDGAEVDGAWIDRQGMGSLKVILAHEATLAQGKTLSLAANLRSAPAADGSGAADHGDALAAAVVSTGGAGGSTESGMVELDFDLGGAERYIQVRYTPDLSADDTDTATLAAVYVLGGAQEQPAGQRAN